MTPVAAGGNFLQLAGRGLFSYRLPEGSCSLTACRKEANID